MRNKDKKEMDIVFNANPDDFNSLNGIGEDYKDDDSIDEFFLSQYDESFLDESGSNYRICPECHTKSLVEVDGDYYVCEECGAEGEAVEDYYGRMQFTTSSMNESADEQKTVKAKDLKTGMITATGKITKIEKSYDMGGTPVVICHYGFNGRHEQDEYKLDKDVQIFDKDESSMGSNSATKKYNEELNSTNENKIDELLGDNPKRAQGPNRYLYAICKYLGWNTPRFLDPAKGGVRLRYFEASEEEAQKTIDEITRAANDLGIDLIRPQVKPASYGAPRPWAAYVIIPKNVAKVEENLKEELSIYNLKTLDDVKEYRQQLGDKFRELERQRVGRTDYRYKSLLKTEQQLNQIEQNIKAKESGKEVVKPIYVTNLIKKKLGYTVYGGDRSTAIRGYRIGGSGDFKVSYPYGDKGSSNFMIEVFGGNRDEKMEKIKKVLEDDGFEIKLWTGYMDCSVSHVVNNPSLGESGALAAAGMTALSSAASGFGAALGNKVGDKLLGENKNSKLNKSIRDWYLSTWKDDKLGSNLNDITFQDVNDILEKGTDIYAAIGVDDSIIRERIFNELARLLGVDSNVIFYKWLDNDDDAKGMNAKSWGFLESCKDRLTEAPDEDGIPSDHEVLNKYGKGSRASSEIKSNSEYRKQLNSLKPKVGAAISDVKAMINTLRESDEGYFYVFLPPYVDASVSIGTRPDNKYDFPSREAHVKLSFKRSGGGAIEEYSIEITESGEVITDAYKDTWSLEIMKDPGYTKVQSYKLFVDYFDQLKEKFYKKFKSSEFNSSVHESESLTEARFDYKWKEDIKNRLLRELNYNTIYQFGYKNFSLNSDGNFIAEIEIIGSYYYKFAPKYSDIIKSKIDISGTYPPLRELKPLAEEARLKFRAFLIEEIEKFASSISDEDKQNLFNPKLFKTPLEGVISYDELYNSDFGNLTDRQIEYVYAVLYRLSNKLIDESLVNESLRKATKHLREAISLVDEINLKDFNFRKEAKARAKYLTEAEFEVIEDYIDATYPNGITSDELNDLFWFEEDLIASLLGYESFDEIMDR